MVIKTPQFHQFSHSFVEKGVKKTGWEISVPQRDGIAWSIVLSHLMSTKYTGKNSDFKARLQKLTGNNEISSKCTKLAKNAIEKYNPFKNRYSSFFNTTLQWVVQEFKKKLNWNCLTKISDKLDAAACLLNCQILRIEKRKNKVIKYSSKENEKYNSIITLIFSPTIDEDNLYRGTACSFILNTYFASERKVSALSYFLREAGFTKKNIGKILSLSDKDTFLITLLKSDCPNLVLDIYKSPYIVTKLSEATYQTDPRLTDYNGFSGLYYALLTENSEIFYKMYYFAANSCFETESSFRNPDAHIVDNFYNLEKILLVDLMKSGNFRYCDDRDRKKKSFNGLLMLNKFLLDVTKKILKTNMEINYNDDVEEKIFQVCKRRDVVVSVLESYDQFFDGIKENDTSISLLQHYVLHKDFYYSIDTTMAVIFFENIFHLKERLRFKKVTSGTRSEENPFKENVYSSIESCIFNLVLYNVAFHKVSSSSFSKTDLYIIYKLDNLFAFLLMKRSEIRKEIMNFTDLLLATVIDNENIVDCLPESEAFAILNTSPVIKDMLQIRRLQRLLSTVEEIKNTDIKSVLAIQRVLQVIGEYVHPEKYNEFSIREILPLCLSSETVKILHRLRDKLSHLFCHLYPRKINFEKDSFSFQLIRKEIISIKMCFKPLLRVQNLQALLYLIKEFEESVSRISSTELYSQNLAYLCKGLLPEIKKYVPKSFELYINDYKYVLECILSSFEETINDKEFWKNSLENVSSEVQIRIRPLIFMTELLSNYNKEHCNNLLKDIDLIKDKDNFDSLEDAKEKLFNFLRRCKSFSLIIFSSIKKNDVKSEEKVENIYKFLKILRGAYFLSEMDKSRIRQEIPPEIRESKTAKEIIKDSIAEDFSLNDEQQIEQFKKLGLKKSELEHLHDCYENKSLAALEILNKPGPLEELEEIFSTNIIKDKETFERLCEKMQFSEQTRIILKKLVPGQKCYSVTSNVAILLDRIQLLKKVLIDDNKEISYLWSNIKSKQSQKYFASKLVQLYLEDSLLRASVEMLLFDCMSIVGNKKAEAENVQNDNVERRKLKNEKVGEEKSENEMAKKRDFKNGNVSEDGYEKFETKFEEKENIEMSVKPWIKSSKLYSGVNLRNFISHGNPLLESLCRLLDPEDLPSVIIDNALRLIKKEDALKEMLDHRTDANCDRTLLQLFLFSAEEN